MYNSLVIKQSFFLVLLIVVGKHADEGGYFPHGMPGVGSHLFLLQAEHHYAVEQVEAGLYLGGLGIEG